MRNGKFADKIVRPVDRCSAGVPLPADAPRACLSLASASNQISAGALVAPVVFLCRVRGAIPALPCLEWPQSRLPASWKLRNPPLLLSPSQEVVRQKGGALERLVALMVRNPNPSWPIRPVIRPFRSFDPALNVNRGEDMDHRWRSFHRTRTQDLGKFPSIHRSHNARREPPTAWEWQPKIAA